MELEYRDEAWLELDKYLHFSKCGFMGRYYPKTKAIYEYQAGGVETFKDSGGWAELIDDSQALIIRWGLTHDT